MDFKTINYEKRDKTALITLNRPEKLNAWTPSMAEELAESINDANKDKSNKERKNILFSPAAASFDTFKNFEERGKYFNYLLSKLKIIKRINAN